ncbi:YuzL family protein [Bacillus sp. 03113]|nr:YuzL family protein [Bacillus sp. 03113]
MSKIKNDRSKSQLGSPEVEGQGTTNTETKGEEISSSRKKQKRS